MIGFKRFCSGVLLSVMCLASSAQAANVLYYFDSYIGTDYWMQAFAARGDTVTTAVDASDLVTQLSGGPWDLVVISENGSNYSATWATPIADYITAGGKVVLNDWYPNAIIDAATEVTDLNNDNQTVATINALGIATGLANGVAINPFTLTNAGWNVFSQALQPTGSAESRCDFPIGSCAVFGNSGRTMRLGFIPDGLPAADGAQILANAVQALFDAPIQPASIPTLSEWGMILLASLLAIWGAFTLQRRRNYL